MKSKLLGFVIAGAALAFGLGSASAVLQKYQPGPRLIDGSQLNLMVEMVNRAVIGPTANTNYKIVRGETALDGTNPTPVATGLTTIASCSATLKSTATPGVDTSVITYDTSSGTLNLYGWKVTNSSTTTMIASTGTQTVGWICVGS